MILTLLISSLLFDTITQEKQQGCYPVEALDPLNFQVSLEHMIQKLTGATSVEKFKERKRIEVYRTEKNIIKVYPHEHYYEFLDEIWALEMLKRTQPKYFTVPAIEATYTLFNIIDNYHLLVLEIFPGTSLDQKRAFYRYGMALAELHQLNAIKRPKYSTMPSRFPSLSWSMKQKLKSAKNYGYIQYDTHPENALYDVDRDQLCLIDLSAVGFFIDTSLKPIASPAFDYVHCIDRLQDSPAHQHAFIQGYQEGGGEHFSEKTIKNYREIITAFHKQKKKMASPSSLRVMPSKQKTH